jgi:hypothetical protein
MPEGNTLTEGPGEVRLFPKALTQAALRANGYFVPPSSYLAPGEFLKRRGT